jgi:hypothetical protein
VPTNGIVFNIGLKVKVNSELGPLLVNAIASGRLFMPSDFVPAFVLRLCLVKSNRTLDSYL